MNKLATILISTASLAAAAHAQTDKILKPLFGRYDKNSDGHIERREFPGSDAQYASMDKNRDKKVTYDEYKDSAVARRFLSARYRNDKEPRERVGALQLQAQRLELLKRFDKNRNGKITRDEWAGSPLAFQTLDANGDGVIDQKDRKEAAGNAAPPAPETPTFRKIPDPEAVMKQLDRNKDGAITKKEARGELAKGFDKVDLDGNGKVEEAELKRVVYYLRRQERDEMERRGRQTAYRVPFAEWDKNKDGRLDSTEFRERRYLFERIDLDRDAAITREEVERYKRSVEGEDFVARYDLNEDGKVTLTEFGGHPAAFQRADTNGDGVVSRRDR